ncbi:hypothetical protein [Hymenobacter sp. BT559]|uniref:hypothetical protein n=1 Tax=Hymenobacter sp. BT559 TaxID=2795729 RepID=UPI0018EA8CD1|nr:hypothetical protein [Hymenobacter sp. BT559]MBJ6142668.1 hypothetical protein [Hymenobacter sp. BT559]
MKTCPTSFQRPAYISLCAHAHRPVAGPVHLCCANPYAGPVAYAASWLAPDLA